MVLRPGSGSLVGLEGFFVLDLEAVIKSAASAASPKTKIQESRGASGRRLGMRTTGPARLPCKSREAALAADLITA